MTHKEWVATNPEIYQQTAKLVQPQLTDGMYRGPGPNNHIYKVYHTVHGSNQQVAKRLVVANAGTLTASGANDGPLTVSAKFKYEGKAPLKFLKPSMRLTMAEAMEFGKLYGACCICGRTLTNELSIHLGIGPVCGQREFGGDFEFLVDAAKLETKQLGDKVIDAVNSGKVHISEVAHMSVDALKARLAEINQELGS